MPATRPASDPAIAQEFAEWLERVRATFEAVQYTCAHRLASVRFETLSFR